MAKQMGAWAIVCAVVLFSQSVWADAVVVKAGEPLTITDENVGEFADGLTFKDAEGVVTFTTTAAPTMSITGAGTLVKDNAASWTLATAQTGFTGTWDFKGGLVDLTVEGGAGKVDASGVGPIYVRSGATFKISVATHMKYREFRLAGTGVDGKGALFCNVQDTTGLISLLRLEEDALMRSDKLWFLQASGAAAQIDLNGKTLTLSGGAVIYMINGKTVNGGTVRVANSTTISHRGTFLFDPLTQVVFEDKATYMLFNDSAPQTSTMTVEGTLKMYHVHQFHASSTTGTPVPCPQDGSKNNWLGEIRLLDAASLLSVGNENTDDLGETLSLGGPITGPGSVDVFGNCKFGRVVMSCPTNAFTGTLTVASANNAAETGWFEPVHSNAIPNYANLNVDNGIVLLKPGAEGWSWGMDSIARLSALANCTGVGTIAVDTSACPDGKMTLSGASLDAVEGRQEYATLSHVGEGVLTVEGPVERPLRVRAIGGTMRLAGDGPVRVSGTNSGGGGAVYYKTEGEILFDGVDDVELTSYPQYIGEAYGAPVWRFRNSTLTTTNVPANVAKDVTQNALVVGGNGWKGTVVFEDSIATTRLATALWSAASQGAVIQKDGVVNIQGDLTDSSVSSGIGMAGHGYYELRSGLCRWLGYTNLGLGGPAVFAQYGGIFSSTNFEGKSGAFYNVPHGAGSAHHYVRSGTLRVDGNILLGRSGDGILTLDGPDAVYRAGNNCINWGYSKTVSCVNLNDGGTLRAYFGARYDKTYYETNRLWRPYMYVNCNGGRIAISGDQGTHGAGGFGRNWELTCGEGQYPGVTQVTLYEKGLVYETASGTANLRNPLVKASGKGVVNIPWTPRDGYTVSPFVTITGDGKGACAFAEFDSDTGSVTNIRVVAHGFDYTWAKAKILAGMGNGKSSSPTNCWVEVDCELADNVSGGFTKEGAGEIVFQVTNTYEGVTAVNGGKLTLGADDVISAKSELSLGGGTLKLENLHQTFAGLRGTGGTVTGGDLKIVPPNGVWEISAKRFLDRESSVVAGTLDLTAVTEIRIVDTELLDTDAEALRSLNLFSATTVVWPDSLTITGPDGWRLVRKPNALGFGYAKGTMLLVR